MAKKGVALEESTNTDSGLPAQAGEVRVYELGFHLDPALASEEAKSAYQEIRALIESKGEIVAEGAPEKVALAYTISRAATSGRRDLDSAYFAWIAYEASVAAHGEVVSAAGADPRIIRFIDLVTDKETAHAAGERAELLAKIPERPIDAEPVSEDVALDAALESATL